MLLVKLYDYKVQKTMQRKINKFCNQFLSLETNTLLICLFFLYFIFSLVIIIPNHTHFFDEGWAASIGNELSQGKLLYKDISAPYGPIVFYLFSAIISIFGKEFFIFRIVGCIIIMLQALYSTKIVKLYTNDKGLILLSGFISLVSLGTYQGCRITASTIAGLTTLMIIFYHLKYLSKNDNKYLFLMGALFSLQLLTKHNVFALDVFANGFFMIMHSFNTYKKNKAFNWKYFLIPTLAFIAFLTPYILSIYPYIKIVINDTILSISEYKTSDITISFPSPLSFFKMDFLGIRLSLFLYSIFPFILATTLIFLKKIKNNKLFKSGMLLVILSTFIHYAEVYPLSDYSHYSRATILYPSFIAIIIYLTKFNRNTTVSFSIILGILLHVYPATINTYSSLKSHFLQRQSELPYHSNINKIPNEDVMLEVIQNIKSLNQNELFIIGHANVFYYLADIRTQTRFNMVTHSYLNKEDEKKVINKIETNNIKYIMEAPSVRKIKDLEQLDMLNSYINENFKIFKKIGEYNFWIKISN